MLTTPKLGVWWVLAVGCVVGLALVAFDGDQLKVGFYTLAAGFLAAAVLRAVRPRGRAGALVIRSRVFDVAAYALLGAALAGTVTVLGLNLF